MDKTLCDYLNRYPALCIAVSGGVDSEFLLRFAHRHYHGALYGVTIDGAMISRKEIAYATTLCRDIGINHTIINIDTDSIAEFKLNSAMRCYFCKHYLFSQILTFAKTKNTSVCEGTQLDDFDDYRPGRKALNELGILSPLAECGYTKQMVRDGLALLGGTDRPSGACLATRIPYDTPITKQALSQIETAENALYDLGFDTFRVRHFGQIAKIEMAKKDMDRAFSMRNTISKALSPAGFRFISLDLVPFRSGNMN